MPVQNRAAILSDNPQNGDFTALVERWGDGDERAIDELLPRAYEELRRLAGHYLSRERRDHTLTPTGLVHEAYLRLFGSDLQTSKVSNRRHFFALAAQSMRRILVENARRYSAARRLSPKNRVPLEDDGFWARVDPRPEDILALDEALEVLRREHPRRAEVVELRYFAGLTETEVAQIQGVSRLTVSRDWRVARMLLYRILARGEAPAEDRAAEA